MKTRCTCFCSLGGFFVSVLILMLISGNSLVYAQVQFIQTTNADFYKGAYNDVLVGSDNVYLPFQATGVGNWLTTTILPQTLTGHKTATWNNRYVYVVGGYNGSTYSSAVYRATLQSGGISGWTTLTSLPVGLRDHAVVIGTNTIYVLGGRNATTIFNTIYYASINSDGSIGNWQVSSVSLPENLWGHTAVYCNGYIYVAGGANTLTSTAARNNVYYARVLADNTLSSFSNATNLPATRNGHSMVVNNDRIFVLGGFANGGTKANTVYTAVSGNNGQLGSWTTATALPIAVSNHASVVINGIVTVMAGESGGTLKNTLYWADVTASTLVWTLSPDGMYDYTKDGAAFASNGQIGYCGGENLSGAPIHNTRYANLTLSSNYKKNGLFISNPFYELGAERLITQLTFNAAVPTGSTISIQYRTAGNDLIWGDWSAATSTSPITVNQTKRYLQYKVNFQSDGTAAPIFYDLSLYTPGTQLSGNLNTIATFTKAASPYWATSDISFTAGTHTFQAGTVILFMPGVTMTVGQASLICNGTAADSVKFMGYTNTPGLWNGIYFNPDSDNGVSSQFYYTVIAHGGNGSNSANLYCNATNEPLLNNSTIRHSSANGIRLNSSHINIYNSVVKNNGSNGVYLENSNPTFISTNINSNSAAGIYYTSNVSTPTFTSTTCQNNLYGLHFPSPNFDLYPPNGTITLTGNTYNGICVAEGVIDADRRWYYTVFDYIMLGNLTIGKYDAKCRLTIEPGNRIKFLPGKVLQVGYYSGWHRGGELYAIGSPGNEILFTSFNGNPGGWEGVFFADQSDYAGAVSVLTYCIIEKGNVRNVYCENTAQPTFNNCIIRNSFQDGVILYGAYCTINNSTFTLNGRYPLYYAEWSSIPNLTGNTFINNYINLIGYSGGNISENRTLSNYGIGYHILNDIVIGKYDAVRRLTISKGLTLYFASGKGIKVGFHSGWHHGGELYAIGSPDSLITFTPDSGIAGDWTGIYFADQSDFAGATNQLKYCIIEKANAYNILCDNTNSVLIENCTIRDAVTDGIRYTQSHGTFNNNTFTGNGRYPVYFTNWWSSPSHANNTFTGNTINMIALSGGQYDENRTIQKDNIEYLILDNILLGKYDNKARITVEPGVTLNFSSGKGIQIGFFSGWHRGGELYAEGTGENPIIFRPVTGIAGDWTGIYFTDQSDFAGATNQLKYCIIEKANAYNILCDNTNSVLIENCTIRDAVTDGIRYTQSHGTFNNNTFTGNGRYPVYFTNWWSSPSHANNTFTGNTINMIAMSGGQYDENRTIQKDNIEYLILDNILLGKYDSKVRITVEPGVTLNFSSGKGIQIGFYSGWHRGGELYAEGTAENPIIFRPVTGIAGDWTGIYFADQSDFAGSTSSLNYCKIEKGNQYNVYAENTTQPVIDNCIFTESPGIGLKLMNSTLTIKRSYITNNGSYGILLDGSSSATIGNVPDLGCSFYNNAGAYEIYNNSANNVNARYNYWGTADSTMIATRIYDKYDNSAKGIVYFSNFIQLPVLQTPTTVMMGWVKYANTASNPMKNAAMAIKDLSGNTIAATTTNTAGNYSFSAFNSGRYTMSITPSNPWGGANSTDALKILRHFAQLELLTGMKLAAADVNMSATVNGSDALFVMRRFANLINSFPSGDYLWHTENLQINGNQITNNIRMICFGDVDASYSPGSKDNPLIQVIYSGNITVGSNTEFSVPIKLKDGMKIGAISLGFIYPEEYFEILGVELPYGLQNYIFNNENGLARIAWCDLNPMNIEDDGVIVTLKMKSFDLSGMSGSFYLEVDDSSELADESANAVPVWMVIPEISFQTTGLFDPGFSDGFAVYPSMLIPGQKLHINLKSEAKVRVSLINEIGQTLRILTASTMAPGIHEISLDERSLTRGVYFIKVEVQQGGSVSTRVVKMVVTN